MSLKKAGENLDQARRALESAEGVAEIMEARVLVERAIWELENSSAADVAADAYRALAGVIRTACVERMLEETGGRS